MIEPTTVTAGDSYTWRRDDLGAYPHASGWALAYSFVGGGNAFSVNASPSGAGYEAALTAAATATWPPGQYVCAAVATHAGSSRRATVLQWRMTVRPNLAAAAAAGLDLRGPARKALEAMDAALESFGATAHLQEIEYGQRRRKFRSLSEFMAFRSQLQMEARREDAANGLAPPRAQPGRILMRFTR